MPTKQGLRSSLLASYRRRARLRSALRKLNDLKVILSLLNDHVRSSQAQDPGFCGTQKFQKRLLRHCRWWLVGVPQSWHTACFPSSGYAVQCQTLWKLSFFRLSGSRVQFQGSETFNLRRAGLAIHLEAAIPYRRRASHVHLRLTCPVPSSC
jgi:hypothetical protein